MSRINHGSQLASTETRQRAIVHFKGVCAWCKCRVRKPIAGETQPHDATLDHLTSHADGGADDLDNLAIVCLRCNSSRGRKPVQSWLAKQLFDNGLDARKANQTAAARLRAAIKRAAAFAAKEGK